MSSILIIDAVQPHRSFKFDTQDSNDILLIMERIGCYEGHIYKDGHYMSTAWKSDEGVWSLYLQKHDLDLSQLTAPTMTNPPNPNSRGGRLRPRGPLPRLPRPRRRRELAH